MPVRLDCASRRPELEWLLTRILHGHHEEIAAWFEGALPATLPAFDQAALRAELDAVESFSSRPPHPLAPLDPCLPAA